MRQLSSCLLAACLGVASVSEVHAQLRAEIVASGFQQPVAIVPDPLVPGVLVVVQQDGLVRAVVGGAVRSTPFLDLRAIVTAGPGRGERGLLGLAFDPREPARVFVNFTNRSGNGDTVVARFRRTPGDPHVADPATRLDLQWSDGRRFIEQPYTNHKGGNLVFGPDGFLYIGLGDGGSSNDPENRAQTPSTLLGKMLRIDVGVAESDPTGFRVPSSNPFVPVAGVRPEIWAFGYRNPWRYSFDDFGAGATGALIVGDVGQGAREEIDYEPAGRGGRNYGWSVREGSIATPGVNRSPAYGPLIGPMAEYDRSVGQSVTGGYVYRGTALGASYRGRYFAADFVQGHIWSVGLTVRAGEEAAATDVADHSRELGHPASISTFGRDLAGELYFASFNGNIYKIVLDARLPGPPTGLTQAVNGSRVSLSWQAGQGAGATSGYQLEVGSAAGASNVLVAYTTSTSVTEPNVAPGVYFVRVRASNPTGLSAPSNELEVRVACANPPPPPSDLSATVSQGIVTLAWRVAAGALRYRVEAGSASALNQLGVEVVGTGLVTPAPPGRYFVRVRAIGACEISASSNEIIVVVP